jgi:hypothetical protein
MSTKNFTRLVQQFRLFHSRLPALFTFLFRLPFLSLSHCFLNNYFFYTPQKLPRQSAFRGSNSSYATLTITPA